MKGEHDGQRGAAVAGRGGYGGFAWRRWGPYLGERQWGTVREDYGSGDNTWSYFSHEQARSRAYRVGGRRAGRCQR